MEKEEEDEMARQSRMMEQMVAEGKVKKKGGLLKNRKEVLPFINSRNKSSIVQIMKETNKSTISNKTNPRLTKMKIYDQLII